MTMDALNERQSAFVNVYVVTGNATSAAIEAGYSEIRPVAGEAAVDQC